MSVALKIPAVQTQQLFTQAQFDEIRQYFMQMTGNKLGPDKRSLLESRLRKIIVEKNIDPSDYIDLIKNDESECSRFVSSLTTHKTDWFRENVHFEFLKKKILERLKNNNQEEMLVWSAACSTGEEPYTLLMTFLEAGKTNCRILATDISQACVKAGEHGIFSTDKVNQQVRSDLVNKYFVKATADSRDPKFQFDVRYKKHFKWRIFNLMSSELNAKVQFDFIFLRNVLIYFEPNDCKNIIQRLTHYIKHGGYIVIGLSETVYNHEQLGLKRVENSVYQKV